MNQFHNNLIQFIGSGLNLVFSLKQKQYIVYISMSSNFC